MDQLDIRLFGEFRVICGHEDLTASFPPRLQALLAFLLLHGEGSLPRDRIAFGFWPDVPEKKARNNLRQLLYRLRRTWPHSERFLSTEGATVGWRLDAPAAVDLHRFEARLAAATTPSDLEEALEHYGGPLLPGHYDEWILRQRERLQQLYMGGLERLATMREQKGEHEAATTLLRRLLAVEPLRESSYLRLMRLHARLRDPAGVERVYQECVDLLDAELGVAPSPNLQQSYEKLSRVATGNDRLVRLPTQPTPLFGRERELLEIGERLRDPQCRLLTLVGPGGIGKTRLAIEAARAAAVDFGDGAVFVSLAGLTSPDYLVSTLAAALEVSFREGEPAERQLLEHLANGEFLLLLDNYEHLLPETGLMQRILAEAPAVQLLVTSRERLRLRWEWLMEVDGLPLPRANGPSLQQSEAVRLFLHHLRRLHPDDAPTDGHLRAAGQISRLTGGMPLALELAAATTRVFSLPELAGRLADSADVLTLSQRDVPERHRSMRAAFEHSWQLLSPREQGVLARLSVFRSSFDVEAATAVAGDSATPSTLAGLVDKSLLKRENADAGDVRLSWHELLRQYATEKLDERPEIHEESLVRHARHYAACVEAVQRGASITPELFRMFAAEIDNIHLAWQSAVRLADHVVLGQLVVGLAAHQHLNGLGEESHHMFESAAVALRTVVYPLANCTRAQQIALGKVLAWQASFVSNKDRGVVEKAQRLANEALGLLEPVDVPLERATALFFRGYACYCLNQMEEAIPDCQQAATIFERFGEKFYLATAYNVLGMAYEYLGELDAAERYGRQMLSLARELGISSLVRMGFRKLASYLRLQESYAEAEQCAIKAYELALRDGDEIGAVIAQYRAAEVAYDQHRFQEARELLLKASQTEGLQQKALAQWSNNRSMLGRVAIGLGKREEARQYLHEALGLYPPLRYDAAVLDELLITVADWMQEERPDRAVELLVLVHGHPECSANGRGEAQRRLAQLARQLPENVMSEARARGGGLAIEATIEQLKAELDRFPD